MAEKDKRSSTGEIISIASHRRTDGSAPPQRRQAVRRSPSPYPGAGQSRPASSEGRAPARPSGVRADGRADGREEASRTVVRPAVRTGGSAGSGAPRRSSPQNSGAGYARGGGYQNPPRRSTSSKKKKRKKGKRGEDSTALSSLVKAIIYITCVLVAAGILGYFGISIGNDVFAFVKDDYEVSVSVSDTTSLDEAAALLKEKGVIRFPGIFKLYSGLRKKNWKPEAGEYIVSPSMNYDNLFAAFQYTEPDAVTVSVTIPEGYTIEEIITLFTEKYGIGTREGFIDAIQNGEYDYWFIKEIDANPNPNRKYRLEGYLYPDTYYFYSTASPKIVISKILANFNVKMKQVLGKNWEETCKELCTQRGFTFDQIVTLASLIQMEAKYEYEYEDVSAVFTNRLKDRSISNGLLQSDATIQYYLADRHADITAEEKNRDDPYNTYRYPGLTPGPITNITINAINYAFYPSEERYCYFYAHPSGYTMFAYTYAEHLENQRIAAQGK